MKSDIHSSKYFRQSLTNLGFYDGKKSFVEF